MKKVLLILTCVILCFYMLVACNNVENNAGSEEIKMSEETKNPLVTMTMSNGDVIKMELYYDIAPITVTNFINLINEGFYDGLTFHRVIPSFMAQGGDPNGDGAGDAGYTIKGEFSSNGVENNLKHEIGVVSMARGDDYNSASSQFFIVTNEESYLSLDGLYAGFGKVVEGMDNVYKIVNSEVIRTDFSEELIQAVNEAGGQIMYGSDVFNQYVKELGEFDRPVNPPVIKSMTVDTFGVNYPETIKYVEE